MFEKEKAAYAAGKRIQVWDGKSWHVIQRPSWLETCQYRVRPDDIVEEKSPVLIAAETRIAKAEADRRIRDLETELAVANDKLARACATLADNMKEQDRLKICNDALVAQIKDLRSSEQQPKVWRCEKAVMMHWPKRPPSARLNVVYTKDPSDLLIYKDRGYTITELTE